MIRRLRRLVMWSGLDGWRAEAAIVQLNSDSVRADGTQLGVEPLPYRLDYGLDAGEGFVTRSLTVAAIGNGWTRRIRLLHDGEGEWRCSAAEQGDAPLPPPGGSTDALGDALDCDLGLSPLTNLMPVRRHRLHEREGAVDIVAAWVSVPDLAIHASRQRYEHVRPGVVRFVDLGLHEGFEAELELDDDGLVLSYPELARRVEAS